MSSVVCTLFEGHYHHGLAALANSLYHHGFRGEIWAGHRGQPPPWARNLVERDGTHAFQAAEGMTIRFLKVETTRHLTNYKAKFMCDLREHHRPDAGRFFYCDPDLVLKTGWNFFEQWTDAGIALCEDVNSPMHSTHPMRKMWHRFYQPHGFSTAQELDLYVNAGFVGVSRDHWGFVETWKRLLDFLDTETDGLAELGVKDRAYPFHKPDQDALNAAAMYAAQPLSIVGKDGMDFIHGGFLMSHALGTPKPWTKAFTREALRGHPPALADHCFWQHTTSPIDIFSPEERRWKTLDLSLACGIARFYARA